MRLISASMRRGCVVHQFRGWVRISAGAVLRTVAGSRVASRVRTPLRLHARKRTLGSQSTGLQWPGRLVPTAPSREASCGHLRSAAVSNQLSQQSNCSERPPACDHSRALSSDRLIRITHAAHRSCAAGCSIPASGGTRPSCEDSAMWAASQCYFLRSDSVWATLRCGSAAGARRYVPVESPREASWSGPCFSASFSAQQHSEGSSCDLCRCGGARPRLHGSSCQGTTASDFPLSPDQAADMPSAAAFAGIALQGSRVCLRRSIPHPHGAQLLARASCLSRVLRFANQHARTADRYMGLCSLPHHQRSCASCRDKLLLQVGSSNVANQAVPTPFSGNAEPALGSRGNTLDCHAGPSCGAPERPGGAAGTINLRPRNASALRPDDAISSAVSVPGEPLRRPDLTLPFFC